jgi:glyoxylase-like metal-dependent hydrolase (beta-lactamase superfamily II)
LQRERSLEITLDDNLVISCDESRALLEEAGIPGEILHTPGHSDDSISLLLDDGAVFTGDLTPPQYVGLEDPEVVRAGWRLLRERGATRVYPAHGPVRSLDWYLT